jgi:hypothetical protein
MEKVKNSMSNLAAPFSTTVQAKDTSGTTAKENALVTNTVTSRSADFLFPSMNLEAK